MTSPVRARVPLSSTCRAADALGLPGSHRACPGDWEQRVPGQEPGEPPVQTYRCGCTCHRGTS